MEEYLSSVAAMRQSEHNAVYGGRSKILLAERQFFEKYRESFANSMFNFRGGYIQKIFWLCGSTKQPNH